MKNMNSIPNKVNSYKSIESLVKSNAQFRKRSTVVGRINPKVRKLSISSYFALKIIFHCVRKSRTNIALQLSLSIITRPSKPIKPTTLLMSCFGRIWKHSPFTIINAMQITRVRKVRDMEVIFQQIYAEVLLKGSRCTKWWHVILQWIMWYIIV